MDARVVMVIILIALCFFAGCSGIGSQSRTEALTAHTWHLVSYYDENRNVQSLVPGTDISIRFLEDGTITGNAGCNDYFSRYTLEGYLVTFGPIASTEKYCMEPGGVMEQEQAYLGRLSNSTRFQVTSDQLILSYYDVRKLLVFEQGE
ncbi:MAG TPA: META domain-containing protein [Methanoregulaceae archaeon]|nr:META domain-containing protein [Methanoregulaceae archaeon]